VMTANKARVQARVAALAGCGPDELILTRNTTESLDTVISGHDWAAGDEAVVTVADDGIGIAEEHLFIIDDLAARRVLAFAPNAGLVIRDNLRRLYFLFTVVDLFLMPKLRVNRRLDLNPPLFKGKWLIDLRNGQSCPDLATIFTRIGVYLDQRETIFSKELACFGAYMGETIASGGVARQPQHWQRDISETR